MHADQDKGRWGKGLASRWSVLLFLTVAVTGLFYVKWNPYYHKILATTESHPLGDQISRQDAAPVPFWQAAYDYAVNYGKAVWQAMLLGLVLGSGVQALVSKDWLRKVFGTGQWRGTALAGIASVPSMM